MFSASQAHRLDQISSRIENRRRTAATYGALTETEQDRDDLHDLLNAAVLEYAQLSQRLADALGEIEILTAQLGEQK